MSVREWLANPIRAGTAAASSVLAIFHAEVFVTVLAFGCANLQHWFYMASLLVAIHQAFPVSQQQASTILAVLGALLLLKLLLQAANRIKTKLNDNS